MASYRGDLDRDRPSREAHRQRANDDLRGENARHAPRNAAHQERVGAVVEYRFLHGTQNDELCLVLSRQISDERIRFLRAIGIDTIWLDDGRFLAGEAPLSDALRAIATVS